MKKETFEIEFGGKILSAEFNDLTGQANGSVMVRYGETVVLVTAVMSANEQPNLPYFPLSVEFEEKFYAAGAILGSRFMRREGRPSDEAVLSARIIDRTIRPLFNHSLRNDIQVVATVLALGEDDPDVIAVIGASLALSVSDIPWDGPVGAVRIGHNKKSGIISINPTYTERAQGEMEFEVLSCGKDGTINMIEVASTEIGEADIMAILEATTVLHAQLEDFQNEIIKKIGKIKLSVVTPVVPPNLVELYNNQFCTLLTETLFSNKSGKAHLYDLKKVFTTAAAALEIPVSQNVSSDFFEECINTEIHKGALERGVRADGRGLDEVRSLFAQAGGVSPVLHGTGIFYRGETHMFTALTLGGPEAAQLIDTMEDRGGNKRFMHHYNFPPFSVGETGRVGGYNRRMIGHGALAEKALIPVLPSKEEFPYTIRLVSETMSSNGSSSMGSVCGSTLAMMDGGVPIKRPVAGIASGVMMGKDSYVLLTDIQGPEDEHGDMDFKVAGTSIGITAIQMDVKVGGVSLEILAGALERARVARIHILETLTAEISEPRKQISSRAPEIISLSILPEQIGLVIGGGGKTINKIKEESGVTEITIEEDGTVYITGKNGTAKSAADAITTLTKIYQIGDEMNVVITKITAFGAFAKMDNHHEGLIHISEIAPFRLETVGGILTEGESVKVAVVKIDDGKIGLSIKKVDPDFAQRKGFTVK
jgi:polyribonucleotide nucleotidyltransferase